MLGFLEWLYALSFGWKIVLLILVLIFTVGTPYFKEIGLFFKYLFTGEKLKVTQSGIRFKNDYEIGTDTQGRPVFVQCQDPSIIIDGGKAILYWYGKGIIWSSLKPFKKRLYGNTAEVSVTQTNRIYDLTVYGVFRKEKIRFEIPLNNIHKLTLKEFVADNTGIRDLPEIQSTAYTKENLNRFEIPTFEPTSSIVSSDFKSDLTERLNKFNERKKTFMEYSFSTVKYSEILNQENKPNNQTT